MKTEKQGRFLISGSSSPQLLKNISESLAGRVAILEVPTLTRSEAFELRSSKFYDYLDKPEKFINLKSSGMSPKGCFIRVGTGIKPMEINMIESLFASRTRNSLRNIVSPRYMDHAFSQLKIYYQEKGFNTNDSLHSHKLQELLRDSKRE